MTRFVCIAAMLAAFWTAPAAASDGAETRSLEAEVLERINQARQDPRGYADALREYRRYFDGRIAYLPEVPAGMVTQEGTEAIDEAVAFLERQAPLPPLGRGELLARAAADHAGDQGPRGMLGHASRDGGGPGERVRRRGGDVYVAESISYGHDRADAVVRQMIVDDGVPGRGHRALLFGRDYRFAGVGCGGHRRYGHMCVVDLSMGPDGAPVLPPGTRLVRTREVARR